MSSEPLDPVALHRENWPERWDPQVVPFVFALHRARDKHMDLAASIGARYGIGTSELDVLATLRRSPSPWVLTPSELQRSLLITSGGLTKVLQQLESKGLVVRLTDSADRRVKPVQLTEEARALIEEALAESLARTRAWIGARVGDAEIAQATAVLEKLVRD